MKTGGLLVAVAVLAVVALFQFLSVGKLKEQVRTLEAMVHVTPAETTEAPSPRAAAPQVSLGSLPQRVSRLELDVAELSKTAEYLAERGVVPPSMERVEQMQAKFFDPAASDSERLRAFRLMRRNGQVTDDVAVQALQWLQTSTNGNTRRDLLRNLDGLTNSAFKQPLLAMADSETNPGVREELIDVLGDFVHDPAVEEKLWQLALNDPSGDVREEAQDALTDGRMTPERLDALRKRAGDPQLPLDERLLALRGLREGDSAAPEVVTELAQLAQNSNDPVTRAKLFSAFDGINDPNLMAPLVYGLQDPNPVVRERAADALGSFASDPRIQEWLQHVIQNDSDPRVKREAHQALEQAQRRRGGRGR